MSRKRKSKQEIVDATLAAPEEEREALILDSCHGDAGLEREVRDMLHALRCGLLSDPTSLGGEPRDDPDPESIGPYRILERLGRGGMGTVYLADQMRPVRRRVALKVIKAGMDTQEVIARFHAEQQALAMMDHPNIARMLDTGSTEQGRPYFVMEYVDGVPLIDYCDRERMNIDARLELFVDICMAVQHAHQKGVIHRDIKPSNILVSETDGKRLPKIIDFGIAKAVGYQLGDLTVETRLGQVIGTPRYMSPEQAGASAVEIDARTDVYALGAVLYELIVGAPPFDFNDARLGVADVQRVICEEDAPRPSTRVSSASVDQAAAEWARSRDTGIGSLKRRLKGDLDWIALRALQKERKQRYASAAELAADVRRHLAGEPVLAGPPTFGYRFRKAMRRHSTAVVVGLLVVASLGIGIGLATFGRSYLTPGAASGGEEARTLLILPMELRGDGEDGAYVGRAFSEALAVHLSRHAELRVLPVPAPGELQSSGALSAAAPALEMGAGRLLTGALTREGKLVTASLSLVATRNARILWGRGELRDVDLGSLAAAVAGDVAAELGIRKPRQYDDIERSGRVEDEAIQNSPLLAAVIGAFRNFDDDELLRTSAQLAETFPDDHDVLVLRSRALLRTHWGIDPASEERAQIEASIEAIARVDPQSPWIGFGRALLHSQDHEYEDTIRVCTDLLARDALTPLTRAEIHDARSFAYRETNRRETALVDMEEAVRLDPMDDRALAGLGELLRELGRLEEGLERGRQSVALNPSSYISRVNLAWQLTQQGIHDEALVQAKMALDLAPLNVQNNWVYGRILYRVERWDEAAERFAVACDRSRHVDWCALQACALERAGRSDEAAAAAADALSLPETQPGVLFLGAYHAARGDKQQAVAFIRRGIELTPNASSRFADVLANFPDYATLNGDPGFEALLEELRQRGSPDVR